MVTFLLPDIARRIGAALSKFFKDMAAKRQIKKENKAIREKNENAKTEDERDDAARDLIDRF